MELNIIVQLIIQDMKNHQLLNGMEKLGFGTENDFHTTNILDIVAQLIGIPKHQLSDDWCQTYMDFIIQAGKYEITSLGENLQPLAEASYAILVSLAKREQWKSERTFHNLKITANGILNPQSKGLGAILAQYINGLKEDTEIVAEHIDKHKTAEKRKTLAIEEGLSLVKQMHAFTEDMMKLSMDQLKEKYHLN
jgi:hypothetical protein